MAEEEAILVVLIGGHGHSGSTLLSRLLGGVPGFCSIGELSYVWTRGVLRNEMCGCGARFHDCDFWRAVGVAAFGGWHQIDVLELLELRSTVARVRHLPLLAAPRAAPRFHRRLERYTEILQRLYRSIQAVSGCDVIVDSSKYPTSAYPLRHVPGVDMRMIHLVRSSHGVCHSFLKRSAQAHDGRSARRPRPSPSRVAVEWTVFNFSLDLLGLLGIPSTLQRYEDFVARPRQQLTDILTFLDRRQEPEGLGFLGRQTVELPPEHSVAGNPMRMRTGQLPLAVDESWRQALSPRNKRLVTTITAPGLARYGYPILRP